MADRADPAELSSVISSLTDVARRVTALSAGHRADEHDEVARSLVEVERTLGTARRRLEKVLDQLGR